MDLNAIEALIRNPPSASLDSERLLALVAYARELELKLQAAVVMKVGAPKGESFAAPIILGPPEPEPLPMLDEKPTPPASPAAAKRKAK